MAVGKASDSAIGGKKYRDASASTTKIADIPDTPTVTSVSSVNDSFLRVAFAASNTGGIPASYLVTVSPGNDTISGNASPLDYTTGTEGTQYGFTVTPRTSNSIAGPISSSFSASYPLKVYTLSQTFNSSGNYTVPALKTLVSIVATGSGGGGGGSGFASARGGGGGGGSTAIVEGITTNSGTTYVVTVGSAGNGGNGSNTTGNAGNAGGITRFSNSANSHITIFNGGLGGGAGSQSGPNGNVVVNGATGANGTNSFNTGSRTAIDNDGGTITTNTAGITSFAGGGAGGSSPHGGNAGATAYYGEPLVNTTNGGNANGPGGGGGASGSRDYVPNEYVYGNVNSGGSGAAGRILVYVK